MFRGMGCGLLITTQLINSQKKQYSVPRKMFLKTSRQWSKKRRSRLIKTPTTGRSKLRRSKIYGMNTMPSRTQKDREVCDRKILYDTEFEAQAAAYKYESKTGDEMKPYRCPGTSHYHITHKDRSKQTGIGGRYMKCPTCGIIRKKKGSNKHVSRCKATK